MKLTETQKSILEEIKKNLIHGDIAEISKKTKFTPQYVSLVVNPDSHHYNEVIVKLAAALISKRQIADKKILNSIA